MFTFTKNSIIVKAWVRRLREDNTLTIESVPNIFNLRAVVQEVLEETSEE